MAKRKPSTRAKAATRNASARRGAAPWLPKWSAIVGGLVAAICVTAGLVLWLVAHGDDPKPAHPVVTLDDTPAAAITKSHARYLLNWADALEDFSNRADTFTESGDAAKWFVERTARARTEAYGGPDGFDAYVFGHAGGTDADEDRYDSKALADGARQMARACREAARRIVE